VKGRIRKRRKKKRKGKEETIIGSPPIFGFVTCFGHRVRFNSEKDREKEGGGKRERGERGKKEENERGYSHSRVSFHPNGFRNRAIPNERGQDKRKKKKKTKGTLTRLERLFP